MLERGFERAKRQKLGLNRSEQAFLSDFKRSATAKFLVGEIRSETYRVSIERLQ